MSVVVRGGFAFFGAGECGAASIVCQEATLTRCECFLGASVFFGTALTIPAAEREGTGCDAVA